MRAALGAAATSSPAPPGRAKRRDEGGARWASAQSRPAAATSRSLAATLLVAVTLSAHYEFESVVVLGVDIHHGQSKASTQPRRSSAESGRRGQTRGGSPAEEWSCRGRKTGGRLTEGSGMGLGRGGVWEQQVAWGVTGVTMSGNSSGSPSLCR